MLDAELGKQFFAPGLALLFGKLDGLEDGEEVLLDGELAEDGLLLGQVAHAHARAAEHGVLVTSLPSKITLPPFGCTRPTIMLKAGGLARALGPGGRRSHPA